MTLHTLYTFYSILPFSILYSPVILPSQSLPRVQLCVRIKPFVSVVVASSFIGRGFWPFIMLMILLLNYLYYCIIYLWWWKGTNL